MGGPRCSVKTLKQNDVLACVLGLIVPIFSIVAVMMLARRTGLLGGLLGMPTNLCENFDCPNEFFTFFWLTILPWTRCSHGRD